MWTVVGACRGTTPATSGYFAAVSVRKPDRPRADPHDEVNRGAAEFRFFNAGQRLGTEHGQRRDQHVVDEPERDTVPEEATLPSVPTTRPFFPWICTFESANRPLSFAAVRPHSCRAVRNGTRTADNTGSVGNSCCLPGRINSTGSGPRFTAAVPLHRPAELGLAVQGDGLVGAALDLGEYRCR